MSSQEFALNSLLEALNSTKLSPSGVSFAGKSLKLNTADDAKEVVIAINECQQLEFLNLEGNTLGVDAAKAVAEALEKHPEFKRALWKDMFTGRMKTEIPQALKFLGAGLVKAQAHLTELDLSDNAFGPIGVEGLAALLRSPSCYALEELRLNNNGLGITGGKLLASALTDCFYHSSKEGKPLPLRVFIAGRNRLENEGAGALAQVFKKIKTLEEVAMPQNGIYHVGITALSEAFKENKGLKVLNLNDNTFGEKGAEAISKVLLNLQELKEINFGDCLLKTKGALLIANGLTNGHVNLEQLILESNEIKKQGGLALVTAMANKTKLKNLLLDANQFGDDGVKDIKDKLKEMGKLNVLGSLEENESEGESEEEWVSDDEPENSSDSDGGVEIEEIIEVEDFQEAKITITEFLKEPSAKNLLSLGKDRENLIIQAAKKDEFDINHFVSVLMKVSSLTDNSEEYVADYASKIAERLYKELFSQSSDRISTVNNCLLVNLGLIKSEDRSFKPSGNLTGCRSFLQKISQANFVPESTKDTVKVFLSKPLEN